ncbi:MAG TPA: 3-hydroxyacyl-CoA dehydrogenase NAD-binding domain-containing protein, partial [Afifellaceae bacterium]|nr:3-hydroxyacyl-CoA dehydrogenase NAD-binding domain-containing protein [Afifellaceae bacterium]
MIKTIGVIGAGQMGNGIAHVAALAGHDVRLVDLSQEQVDKAMETIGRNLDRQVRRKIITKDDKAAALARIKTGIDYAIFGDCDIVIEAATENEEIKRSIFKTLVPHLNETALLATNTSSLSITRLATVTDRPERFIGMHFMNPVPLMKLIELIRGLATSDETFQTVRKLAEDLGKTIAVAEDFPAFIVNRILLPMINEAIYTLYEGVGGVEA